MEEVLNCAFYVYEDRNWEYMYDVQFTEVGPTISNFVRKGFEWISVGGLEIFENHKMLYECKVD